MGARSVLHNDRSGSTPGSPVAELPKALAPAQVRSLLLYSTAPEARTLAQEVLRLHRLIMRVELFLTTARRSGLPETLDITSRNLASGLITALAQEPAVTDTQEPYRVAPPQVQDRTPRALMAFDSEAMPPTDGVEAAEKAPQELLFTWKLTPEPGRSSARWKGSLYRGPVVVRAHSAVEARELAATRFTPGGQLSTSPWVVRSLVRCVRSEETTYDRVDAVSIVYP